MNAFTCTGSYAIMILYGIKRMENRNMLPEPREGRAAILRSKSFCKEQYGMFMSMAAHELSPEDFEKLPAWREVKDWPGKVVGDCEVDWWKFLVAINLLRGALSRADHHRGMSVSGVIVNDGQK